MQTQENLISLGVVGRSKCDCTAVCDGECILVVRFLMGLHVLYKRDILAFVVTVGYSCHNIVGT